MAPLRPEEISSAEAHPAEPPRGKTAYRMQPKNWRGKVTNTLKKSGDLCIYRCVPPTHEYGTRPFLRWARSQGRSPHASGKAKNTFDPVGIPLFGAPQAPGNKPNPTPPPRRGYKPGGMAPWGRRKSPVPRHTRQNRPEIKRPTECNPTTGEEKRSAGTSQFSPPEAFFIWKKGNSTSVAQRE